MNAWTALLILWLAVGIGVAGMLAHRGHPAPTVLAAVPCWPLLAPLLGPAAPSASATHALDRLQAALAEHGDPADLGPLRAALHDAELRLTRVDRVLAEEAGAAPPEALAELGAARARTAQEIDAVLAEVARLRIRIGLRALEGAPLTARLADLAARVRAADEVAAIIGPR
jgi:hypothetical protein